MDSFLRMKGVSKTFGEVSALHDVDFEVGSNEIVGLLGDNGAGKSTLVKIITGYHQMDKGGELWIRGRRVEHLSVPEARKLGIEIVYQERALADKQSLWRNIFLGRETTNRWGLLDVKGMREETRRLMQSSMGFTSSAITPDSIVKTFSGGERQGVAITRALYFKADLIILDEPTMGLSLSETQKCLDFVEGIKREGKSCIFIDHNIFHVYPVCDRIVVIDRGTVAGQYLKDELSLQQLIDKLRQVAQTGSLGEPGEAASRRGGGDE
jgi:simple sugar transport system ATP-binding protein